MKRSTSVVLLSIAAASAALVAACATLKPPAAPYAVVEAATTVAPSDLHRVVVQSVDGRGQVSTGRVPPNVSVMFVRPGYSLADARSTFYLTPGEHTLDFTAVIDRRDAITMLRPTAPFADGKSGVLKLTVEPGKRYMVAAKVNEGRPEDWKPVVYRVDEIKNYKP